MKVNNSAEIRRRIDELKRRKRAVILAHYYTTPEVQEAADFLGEIPIVQSIMEGSDEGRPAAGIDPRVEKWYREIAEKTVEKVMKSC